MLSIFLRLIPLALLALQAPRLVKAPEPRPAISTPE